MAVAAAGGASLSWTTPSIRSSLRASSQQATYYMVDLLVCLWFAGLLVGGSVHVLVCLVRFTLGCVWFVSVWGVCGRICCLCVGSAAFGWRNAHRNRFGGYYSAETHLYT